MKYEERCSTAIIVTTEKILSQIDDNKDYTLSFFRDESGKIKSVLLDKE